MTTNEPSPQRRWRPGLPKLYRSTWVFVGFLAVILGLLNVPGQLSVEFMLQGTDQPWGQSGPIACTVMRHGWPLVAIERGPFQGGVGRLNRYGCDSLGAPSPWRLTDSVFAFRPVVLVLNVAIGVAVLSIGAALFQRWRARRSPLLKFYLSDLLAVVTLVAIGFGLLARARAGHQAEEAALTRMAFDDIRPSTAWQPAGPTWLRNLLGDAWFEPFDRVVLISLGSTELAHVAHFHELQAVRVSLYDAATAQLASLEQVPGLVFLDVQCSQGIAVFARGPIVREQLKLPRLDRLRGMVAEGVSFSGDGLENCPALEFLNFKESEIAVAAMEPISKLPELDDLTLQETSFSNAALVNLEHTQSLRVVAFFESPLDDVGLKQLERVPKLRAVILFRTKATPRGIAELRVALPQCEVSSELDDR